MRQQFPLLKDYINKIITGRGFTRRELCERAGYANITKACNKLTEFTRSGIVDTAFINRILDVLEPDPDEINRILFEERVIRKRIEIDRWRESIRLPGPGTGLCNHCIFLCTGREMVCTHPLLKKKGGKLHLMKYAGVMRPEWCPIPEQAAEDQIMTDQDLRT